MEPFSIRCTTCHAGLKIRKPEAIGQIYACPKCGSMVLVQRPESSPSGAAESDSTKRKRKPTRVIAAQGIASFDQVDEILGDHEDTSKSSMPSDAASSQAANVGSAPQAVQPEFDETAPAPAGIAPIGPGADWNSATTTKSRNLVFYAIASCIGIALAVGTFRVYSRRNPPTTVSPNAVAESELPEADALKPSTETRTSNPVVEEPKKLPPERIASAEPVQPEPVQRVPDAESKSAPARDPTIQAKLEIVELIPESQVPPLPKKNDHDAHDVTTKDLPATSRPIDHFDDVETDFRDVSTTPVPRLSNRDVQRLADGSRPSDQQPPRKPLPIIDAGLRLQDTFSATNLKLPLESFLRFIANATTVPVTIRPEALVRSRVRLNRPVSVNGDEISHGQALGLALKPIKLGYRTDTGHIIVDRANTISGRSVEYSHFVGDLLQTGWTVERLGTVIRALVAPHSWEGRGGRATMRVTSTALETVQTESIHFEIMNFCERLRLQNGLALQSKASHQNLSKDLWQQRSELAQRIPPKRRNGSLQEMLHEFDRVAGKQIRILPDWHALAQVGWGPDSKAAPTIRPADLNTSLEKWLGEMQLAYRYAGDGYLEVTSPAAERQRFEIGFHAVDDLVQDSSGAQQLIAQLKSALGQSHFEAPDGTSEIIYDELSGKLLTRLSQSKQLEVDWLLGTLRQR